MSRRKKVVEAQSCGAFSWQQWWDCKLSCGHGVTIKGQKGRKPQTATCYKCGVVGHD